MHRVIIETNGLSETFFCNHNKKLSELLIENSFLISMPCGGNGTCGKCRAIVNGSPVLSCRYNITSDITVFLPSENDIESVSGLECYNEITAEMFLALDIGTTTIALALVAYNTNQVIKEVVFPNPQRIFGADVISRIDYCTKNSIDALHNVLITKINDIVNDLLNEYNISAVPEMFVSGNTTMLHTFFGIDCSSMGVSPYKPVFIESKQLRGSVIGLSQIQDVISLPCISAFAGADIVSGINYVDMPSEGKMNMLIDLGTNAECVIFSKDEIICTSAAAGPCFEGANISCGTPAVPGAIFKFEYKDKFRTICDAQPVGICATGLIDIVAELLKNNIIDETGRMASEKYNITDDIYISQEDIRNFQTAKSAVYSAIRVLIKKAGCTFRNIDKIYISGGFSDKLNFTNAVITGLLPGECLSKYKAINNSSLAGTIRYALNRNDLNDLIKNARYIDLASEKEFSGLFIDNIMFTFFE